MADVFLMGTSGSPTDPNRSRWREPIKEACKRAGISYFDPVVSEWNEAAMQAELDALRTARVIAMAVTADTAGLASLAESGWAALSAVQRNQAFGIFIDIMFVAEGVDPRMSIASKDLLQAILGKKKNNESGTPSHAEQLADASRRARKLVGGHANELAKQFPELNLFVAGSVRELAEWTVNTAKLKAKGLRP